MGNAPGSVEQFGMTLKGSKCVRPFQGRALRARIPGGVANARPRLLTCTPFGVPVELGGRSDLRVVRLESCYVV
jgi:hypothetical protein